MIASSLLSHIINPIRTSTSGKVALRMMNDYCVRHLPIVNNELYLGLVSEDDILNHNASDSVGSFELELTKVHLKDDDHLYKAIKLMSDNKLTIIPVIDKEENFLGVITQDDLLSFFANIGSFKEPGSIIVLEMTKRDYSLAEISRIVEAENAAILSTFITTSIDSDLVDVTLKINKQELKKIVTALERYEYRIKASFQEMEYFHSLKERYDSLMNYLDV